MSLSEITPPVVFDTNDRKVTYHAWTDGHAIGYKVTRDDGKVEYVYLNPSGNDDGSDDPNVFVYSGEHGDPSRDSPHVHIVQRFGAEDG
jgi:hypothetical protein